MSQVRRSVFRRALVALGVPLIMLAGLTTGGSAHASAGGSGGAGGHGSGRHGEQAEPGRYLLSLGDSLAFGYQGRGVDTELKAGSYSPDHFPGYVVPLALQVGTVAEHRVRVVNYGCPGETTASMLSGPCGYADAVHAAGYPRALHDDFAGSQLGAAVSFLRAHRGEVSPITVSIGANDLNNLFNDCARDATCVQQKLPATLATLASNLGTALAALRREAPRAQVIVLTPYNPAYVLDPATDGLLAAGNATISSVASRAGARVADGFAAINLAIPGQEQASVCTYTLMCTQSDIHPQDAGYQRLADALWTASGYADRAEDHGHRAARPARAA